MTELQGRGGLALVRMALRADVPVVRRLIVESVVMLAAELAEQATLTADGAKTVRRQPDVAHR